MTSSHQVSGGGHLASGKGVRRPERLPGIMKISDRHAVGRGGPTPSAGATRAAASSRAASPAAKTAPAALRAVNDTSTVMDIPAAELTPKVRAAIETLMREVADLREELRRSQARIAYLEKLADEDALVPALNRRAFIRELTRAIAYSQRYDAPSSLIYFDIDQMKQLNDTYGHGAGDAALTWVVDVVSRNVREVDVIGRLGGDEFGVLLVNADEKTAVEKAAALVQRIAEAPFVWNGHTIHLKVSAGSYTFSGRAEVNADSALDAADRAMYASKFPTVGPSEAN